MFLKYKIRTFFLFVVAIKLLCAQNVSSQNIRTFTSFSDKRNPEVICLAQSPVTGELWIGTNNSGLVVYDGRRYKRYSTETGLLDNTITSLFFQKNTNTLWIGYKNGKISICKNRNFSDFKYNDSLTTKKITGFVENNGIWFSTYGAGLYYVDNKETLHHYDSNKELSDDILYTLYNNSKNKIWAGSDAGIFEIETSENNPPHFKTISMKDGLPDNIVRCIIGSDDHLWLGMHDSGVCEYDSQTNKILKIKSLANWKFGTVNSLCFSNNNSLYIGTQNFGIIEYDIAQKNAHAINFIDTKDGLLDNQATTLLKDRENNIWIGAPIGLSEISLSRLSFIDAKKGLISEKIYSLFIDSKNNYWIATDKGLVKYFALPNGAHSVKNYFTSESSPEKQIIRIYEDKKGILWLGTYSKGLYRFDPQKESTQIISQKQGLAYDNVSGITGDSVGNIWVSTLGGGISKVQDNKGKIQITNYSSLNGLAADYVYNVFVDSKNKLWIATDGQGLITFDGISFTTPKNLNKIANKTFLSVTEDTDGNVWFSTSEQGLYRYNASLASTGADTLTNFTAKHGLPDNNPLILSSFENNIITVHTKGINVLDTKTLKNFFYPVTDIEPNLNACFTQKSGYTNIGTNFGVLTFRIKSIPSDTITPLVSLNSIVVQSKQFPTDSTVSFSYKQNDFVFNFSAVWLRSSERIKIKYKLIGNDNDYIETTSHTASYYSLPSGTYTLSISASNEEGIWSVPINYSFTIATPFWLQWWFWILSGIILISFVLLFVRYRLKALQKEKIVLEQKVENRTAELRKQTEVIREKNIELEYLSIVARETGNPILIMDGKGILEWVNYSFEILNGMTLDELKKEKGESIFDISNHHDIKNIVASCIGEKKTVVYESKNTNKKGTTSWQSSTLTPIFDCDGNLHKLVIIDTDVTKQKQSEEIIRTKNKDITDSIEYAKRIQNSILPDLSIIKTYLPQSFIYYLQKDIVSGDFYWFSKKENNIIIACIDCTGHGVPGAFMSIIGYNVLNAIVNDNHIEEPAKILEELNKGVINALYKNTPNNTTKDGMDAAICNINLTTNELQFSGAMRPLYMVNQNGFEEIKGDKISIGTKPEDRIHPIKFTNHCIKATAGTSFYISSDGYADQFGGLSGKKMMTRYFKEILTTIHNKPFEEQHQILDEHHKQWKGHFEQVDDVLVIGFQL